MDGWAKYHDVDRIALNNQHLTYAIATPCDKSLILVGNTAKFDALKRIDGALNGYVLKWIEWWQDQVTQQKMSPKFGDSIPPSPRLHPKLLRTKHPVESLK